MKLALGVVIGILIIFLLVGSAIINIVMATKQKDETDRRVLYGSAAMTILSGIILAIGAFMIADPNLKTVAMAL